MRRPLAAIVSVVLLLLSAATAVGWVRSFGREQCVGIAVPGRGEVDVMLAGGELGVIWGPPMERFVGPPRFIGPPVAATRSRQKDVWLGPRRSAVVWGAGPWMVMLFCDSGGGGSRGGGPRRLAPVQRQLKSASDDN